MWLAWASLAVYDVAASYENGVTARGNRWRGPRGQEQVAAMSAGCAGGGRVCRIVDQYGVHRIASDVLGAVEHGLDR